MKSIRITLKITSFFFAALIFFNSCASTTLIQSEPSGAILYLDGMKVGETPYTHSDTKIVGATTVIKMKKEGFEDLNVIMTRNEKLLVGALIGGLFVWIPFLWIMGYDENRIYELDPINDK